ncbi:claudin-4-like [Silurus meridionalis]|uniref:claudin-4-like n=1 Tax=Silurus meridionalis TaxID=175797 RepID=UPI001EEA27FB|nr:claudin-4-like [Silurus meridionalis]
MVSQRFRYLGILAGILGWLGVIIACSLPKWSMTAFIGTNIVTAQLSWQGLWKACEVKITGTMRCTAYDTLLDLNKDLLAIRAMVLISILAGFFGIVMSGIGGMCNKFITDARVKSIACIIAGVAFIFSGVLCMIPVSWTAYSIIADYKNPILMFALRRQLGTSLYIGWGSAGLLLFGGVLLCFNCPLKEHIYNQNNSSARITTISRNPPLYAAKTILYS